MERSGKNMGAESHWLPCVSGPYAGRLLIAGDDRGRVTLPTGRYILVAEAWHWEADT